jgi:D-3-phosphoglycerate dehydrogenase / 2-oxoglutarate reductase
VSARSIPRLVYFDRWTDPVANQLLSGRPDIELVELKLAGDERENWAQLGRAHGYQALTRTEAATRPGVGERWLPGAELLARCPDLLAVCSAGAGYDVIDVAACTAVGVIVCNNSGPGAEAVAEHALGFMLALCKKIALADRVVRRERIADRSGLAGSELRGKTLGLVGLGPIGRRLVELCAPFEMEILACDPYLTPAQVEERGAAKVELHELLRRADFVLANCPLTSETRGMFGRAEFARMKPGAFFISTARGEIHDEDALHDALKSGEIAGAALDVFHREPPAPDHPLLALDNLIATPHIAGITAEATRELARAAASQWLAIFAGRMPPRLINPEVWPRYRARFERILSFRPAELA